jgi:hypothetical protein
MSDFNKVSVIKAVRAATGASLVQAKSAVDGCENVAHASEADWIATAIRNLRSITPIPQQVPSLGDLLRAKLAEPDVTVNHETFNELILLREFKRNVAAMFVHDVAIEGKKVTFTLDSNTDTYMIVGMLAREIFNRN